ncbi:3-(methylthio)propionyl-CoA ligase [Ramlibacter solisilvae]|uniref:Long-chain fatty acid--CoA ligase n=1 Tax=Ramlibacter tataouinensis TaxID=94132 RepID=A0A127JXB1_9BURK|nr:3-(methylthio)propionyl-CoA ligase [Ramlibacter tataouinensis]AMO24513.1 long-chain fatty acid--CoA ligase [Ramlibacter tataouinensis]
MQGSMMQMPLNVSALLQYADRHHGDTEIVSRRVEGGFHRTTWRELHTRTRQLANALTMFGLEPGERVATLAWNGHRHLELYYAVGGSGKVVHTINPRLLPEQIAWMLNHSQARVLFFDTTFLPLVEAIAPHCKALDHLVVMTARAHMPVSAKLPILVCYEEIVDAASTYFEWPELDENSACGICYTSGTTGNPKGVLYSQRATILHAYASALPDALCMSSRDVVLPVVPMFHVNAWGLPYSAALAGAKLVLPGPALDGKSLHELMEYERVTFAAGVPTIWQGLLQYASTQGVRFTTLRRTVIGGSACPPSMIRTFEQEHGVEVIHAWGMTELSPLGAVSRLKARHLGLPKADQQKVLEKQGHAIFGIDMKIVDEQGDELPWDGKAFGELMVRGPWVIEKYFGIDESPLQGGWFPTGDVATIDADGYMQITDRAKDLIKSGGEWISSIELENHAAAHPAVALAAVIGVPHPKWDERPLLLVVKKPGAEASREELLKFFDGKVARFAIPDDVLFTEALPLTATGKVHKLKLREQHRSHLMPL